MFVQALASAALIPVFPALSFANSSFSRNGKCVILLELAGANDGLNTLVPYRDERYRELRPVIGLPQKKLITLDDQIAFHKSLTRLMPLWENSEAAVVHGLGYPLPNRSHFKSIALWETGGDGKRAGRHGWATHDLEHAYASSEVDAHGIVLGGGMGIFSSDQGNWLSMSSADQFSNRLRETGSSRQAANPVMAQLLERARVLQSSLRTIASKVENNRHRARIKGGLLSQQLSHAVNIINSGIDVPVIKVKLAGFDTHENQSAKHDKLLKELASAIKGVRRELQKSGRWNDTLLVTYSEFGRRARENKSAGTDHGTAAPHFVIGGSVNGGQYGEPADLGNLVEFDLQHTMDYRAVYSRVLSDWLELPTNRFQSYSDDRLSGLLNT